jgi:SAM-dependent methyltransferase
MNQISEVKKIYENGGNIMDFLKSKSNATQNSTESILISYDFQAGTYTEFAKNNPEYINNYAGSIAKVLDKFDFNSIIEIGVGEATTLGNVVQRLVKKPKHVYGFDLSWSRIKYAQEYLKTKNITGLLFTGNLFNAPIADKAIDVVYTSHSIEPNGGKEKEALQELYRITNKYLVLLEPAHEFADEEGKKRMERLGYIKNLHSITKELGYKIIEYRKFDYCANPLNPTGLIVIEKQSSYANKNVLACPFSKTILKNEKGVYYSKESFLAYPIVAGVPCLLPENAVLATHFDNI